MAKRTKKTTTPAKQDGDCLLSYGCHVHFYAILPGNVRRTHVAGLWGEEDDIIDELDYMMDQGFDDIKLEFARDRSLRFQTRYVNDKWQKLMWKEDIETILNAQEHQIILFLNDHPEASTLAIMGVMDDFDEADLMLSFLERMSENGLIIKSHDGDSWSSLRQPCFVGQ